MNRNEVRKKTMFDAMVRFLATRWTGGSRVRDDRGDVPGWVLITVMTAGLVAALWAIAGPQLAQMLSDALGSVQD